MTGLGLVKPLADEARRDLTDVGNGAELLKLASRFIQSPEMRGQHLSRFLADLS